MSKESLKEEFISIAMPYFSEFTTILKSIISFPSSVDHCVNDIVSVNLMVKIDSEIFI